MAGLRREELAQLAGVSVDYYVRLEQGRTTHASDAVLDAVARALLLSATEREHLANLARPARLARLASPAVRPSPADGSGSADDAGSVLAHLLGMMDGVPALVLGPTMDVLAWNALAQELFGLGDRTPLQRNVARRAFLDDGARTQYRNWDALAAASIAHLHLQLGRYPHDRDLTALVEDLRQRSPEFRDLWVNQDVREGATLTVDVDHPVVREIELTNVWLAMPTRPDRVLVAYTVEPDSLSAQRLGALAAHVSQPA